MLSCYRSAMRSSIQSASATSAAYHSPWHVLGACTAPLTLTCTRRLYCTTHPDMYSAPVPYHSPWHVLGACGAHVVVKMRLGVETLPPGAVQGSSHQQKTWHQVQKDAPHPRSHLVSRWGPGRSRGTTAVVAHTHGGMYCVRCWLREVEYYILKEIVQLTTFSEMFLYFKQLMCIRCEDNYLNTHWVEIMQYFCEYLFALFWRLRK